MELQIPGRVQFARFAIPCILINDGVNAEGDSDFGARIISCIDAGKVPEPRWLIGRFPDATEEFRRFAGIRDLLTDEWPTEQVDAFWEAHKGWRGVKACATMKGRILRSSGHLVFLDFGDGRGIPMENRFSLPGKVNNIGFCHHGILCREIPPF